MENLDSDVKSTVIIQSCFKEQIAFWRREFEAERLAMVPSVTCRICQAKFYANQAKRHGELCNKKINNLKKQMHQNRSFLSFSSKVTEAMLNVKKELS